MKQIVWTHHLNFAVYGARIGVRSNDAEALEQLQTVFPPHWKYLTTKNVDWQYSLWFAPRTRSGRKPFHVLYGNEDEVLARVQDLKLILTTFDRDVQLAVAQKAHGKVFVHAGVVGWHGRAIVIPGRSFSGKSTLTRALVRAGATYYSDEYAVLDTQGRVHPFARQLALRNGAQANEKISFEELGGTIGTTPLPVGTVVVTNYAEGAKWRPKVLTPGLGALELLANTVTARSGQPMVLEVLTRVAQNATIWKGKRGDADVLAEVLLRGL